MYETSYLMQSYVTVIIMFSKIIYCIWLFYWNLSYYIPMCVRIDKYPGILVRMFLLVKIQVNW